MSEKPSTDLYEHRYPHQTAPDGEVSHEALAQDLRNHPEAYHPGLAPHIDSLLARNGLGEVIKAQDEALPNPSLSAADIRQLLAERKPTESLEALREKLEQAGPMDIESALLLVETKNAYLIPMAKLSDADRHTIVLRMIETGQGMNLSLRSLRDLDSSIAYKLIENDQAWGVLYHPEAFKDLDMLEAVRQTYLTGQLADVPQKALHLIPQLSREDFAAGLGAYLHDDQPDFQFRNFLKTISDLPREKQPRSITVSEEVLGRYTSPEAILFVSSFMESEELSPEAARLGITEKGEKGLEQLKQLVAELKQQVTNAEISREMEDHILDSSFLRSVMKLLVRHDKVKDTYKGDHSDEAWKRMLRYRKEALQDGRVEELSPAYTTSKVYEIATLEGLKTPELLTEDMEARYAALKADIEQAIEHLRSPRGFSELFAKLRQEVSVELDALALELRSPTLPDKEFDSEEKRMKSLEYKTQNLQRRYDELAQYVSDQANGNAKERRFILNSPRDFAHAFEVLERYPSLHSSMRQVIFAWAMRKHPSFKEKMQDLADKPGVDDLAVMRDFIENIVNQETFEDYFDNKKSANRFKQMTSTKALEDGMDRYQKLAKRSGTEGVQFIPTRGLMMELSGYVGSACWAGQYESIAEAMPNMTAIMMKRYPGTEKEELIGSALLIESRVPFSKQKALVLRGVNPIEDYINKVDVGSFYDAITDYVRELAEKQDMIPAIVIDRASGMAATNRPVLHKHMVDQISGKLIVGKGDYAAIPVRRRDTKFNGYNISWNTHRLPISPSNSQQ